jgi:hypothetical protein
MSETAENDVDLVANWTASALCELHWPTVASIDHCTRACGDLIHGQLHVPEVGFAQVHPGSQKIVPHVGAMHAPAWLFAAVQRQAA